jgi:arylsulfatase A-like enzyme
MRTPWIIHWPSGLDSAGKVCEQLVSTIDIAPTFLTLAGAKVPAAIQGRSFLAQVAEPAVKICDYVFGERNWQVEYCHERALRHGPWSYYRNGAPELAHFGFVNATFPEYRFPSYVDLWEKLRSGEPLTAAQQTVFLQPRPREQLFNLDLDPMEVNDLANDPDHQQVIEQLRGVMDQWLEQTGDTLPPRDRRTPDRHDRLTGKRLLPGGHPGPAKYEPPGQSAGATSIHRPGPR